MVLQSGPSKLALIGPTAMASKYRRTPPHNSSRRQISRTVSECSNSTSENLCPICHENESIYAVAPCNHSICFKCSTRLRLLLRQFYCPICRADCAKVYFVNNPQDYQTIDSGGFHLERKAKVWLADQTIRNAYDNLVAHRCSLCPNAEPLRSFKDLNIHVKREHQRFFCDICSENVKLFSSERKTYDRKELALHKRKGDEDDMSFKGHPLCQICDNRFLDTDELWRHLRKDHFYCHFCDADGEHIYFGTYDDVKDHFRSDHFLCEEDDCANIQFTTAFRSELDLKAHRAQYHLKGSKRSQRQARTVELNFNYGESRRNPRNSRPRTNLEKGETYAANGNKSDQVNAARSTGSRFTQEDMDTAKAIAASLDISQSVPLVQEPLNMASNNDFPMLPGEARLSVPVLRKPAVNYSCRQALDDITEYPSLSASSPSIPLERSVGKPSNSSASKPTSKPTSTPTNHSKQSSTPAQAAVKAKSNPWSSTDEEFPTLEGSSSGKLHIHGWHYKKPEPKPAPKFINNSRPVINSEADFPTLGDNPGGSLASLATWINANRPSARKMPAPAPDKALISSNDTVQPTPSTPKKEKKKKKKTGTESGMEDEKDKSDKDSTLKAGGCTDKQVMKNCSTSNKAVSNKSQTAGKTKSSNQRPSKKLASLEVDLAKDFPTLTPSNDSKTDKPTEVEPAVKEDNQMSVTAKKEEKTTPLVLDSSDYPSLPTTKNQRRKPPPGLPADNRPVAAPGLSWIMAPPGLAATKKPPGLALAEPPPPEQPAFNMDSIATLLNGSDRVDDPSMQQTYVEPINFTRRNKKLSFKLKELIYNDTNKFHRFKNFTIDFRSGILSPSEFYRSCESLLGVDVFLEILPELIALLPDISKQQQLHSLCTNQLKDYHQSKQLWSTVSDTSLVTCSTCQQVLLTIDFSHHEASHGVEVEDFPILPHSSSNNNAAGKPTCKAWAGI